MLSLRRRGISVLVDHHAGKSGLRRGTSRREDVLDTVIALRHADDYDPASGARFEVHFEKSRNIHGADVDPFEVRMETSNGAAVWTMSSLEDVTESRVRALLEENFSIREVAQELGISRSKVLRIKQKLRGAANERDTTGTPSGTAPGQSQNLDNTGGTLKELASKVLNRSVPPVPPLKNGTPGTPTPKTGTPLGQGRTFRQRQTSRSC